MGTPNAENWVGFGLGLVGQVRNRHTYWNGPTESDYYTREDVNGLGLDPAHVEKRSL